MGITDLREHRKCGARIPWTLVSLRRRRVQGQAAQIGRQAIQEIVDPLTGRGHGSRIVEGESGAHAGDPLAADGVAIACLPFEVLRHSVAGQRAAVHGRNFARFFQAFVEDGISRDDVEVVEVVLAVRQGVGAAGVGCMSARYLCVRPQFH